MQNKSLQYVFLLILFTVVLDAAFGKLYNTLYFTEKSKKIDRLIHSAIGTNEEVLIFGSSRAYHHYNPDVFEKELGMSCFNVGYGGQNIFFHIALLKSAIERNKPKVAILDLISIDIEETNGVHDKEKLGILLPFVQQSNIFYETVLMRGETEKIKLLSSIYPLNSKQLYMVRNNLSASRSDIKGYVGLDRVWNQPLESKKVEKIKLNTQKMAALNEFITLCKSNNIQLFVCISPHFANFNGNSSFEPLAKILLDKHQIKLLNYENHHSYFKKNEYFSDPYHLNKVGADLYSKEIAQHLKAQIQKD